MAAPYQKHPGYPQPAQSNTYDSLSASMNSMSLSGTAGPAPAPALQPTYQQQYPPAPTSYYQPSQEDLNGPPPTPYGQANAVSSAAQPTLGPYTSQSVGYCPIPAHVIGRSTLKC